MRYIFLRLEIEPAFFFGRAGIQEGHYFRKTGGATPVDWAAYRLAGDIDSRV